jgi:hypothetical protein
MLKPVVPVFILISPGKILHLDVCIHTRSMRGRGHFIVLEDAADIPDSVLNANYYGSVSSINSRASSELTTIFMDLCKE